MQPPTGAGTESRKPRATPLVERELELAALADVLDRAAGGSGGVVVIEGEAGVGKSRLLAEARELAEEREMGCLWAGGAELERGFAFGVVRQILERGLAHRNARDEILGGAAAPVAALLDPSLPVERPPDLPFALVHGTYWACARICEQQPTAFLIDDLQWADDPSVQALRYLGRRAEELPAALILAARSGEGRPAGGAPALFPGCRTLELSALGPRGSAEVFEALIGSHSSGFSAAGHRASGGNPFLLREIALAVATGGYEPDEAGAERVAALAPPAVARWALARVDEVEPDARRLALSLAVLERAELQVAADHCELDHARAARAADCLVELGILEAGLPLRFAHPIVRRSLYERLPPALRERAHHAGARLLHDRGAAPELICSHLLETEPRGEDWAVGALRAAAEAAAGRGGGEQAVGLLRRALEEPGRSDDPQLLLALGLARLSASDPGAGEDLEAASRCASEPGLEVAIKGALAQCRYLMGDTRGAFDAVRAALDAIPPGGGGTIEAELLFGYGIAGRPRPELLGEVRARLAEPRPGPDGELTPAEVVRRHLLAFDAYFRGARDDAARGARWAAKRMLDPVLSEGLPSMAATGPGFVLAGIDAHNEAERLIGHSLDRARRRGSRLETAEALNDRVWSRWRRGDVAGGLADSEAIFALTEEAWEIAKIPTRVARSQLLLERSEIEAARAELALRPEVEAQVPGTWGWAWLPIGHAGVAFAGRDWRGALSFAQEAGERSLAIDAGSPEYCWWRSLAARAAARLGRRELALELAEEEISLGRQTGSPRAIGLGLSALGWIRADAGSPELLEEACEHLSRAHADLELARARLQLGMLMRRARRDRDAREPLRGALDVAWRCGAPVMAESALAELRAAGGRPRRAQASGADSLTARERQVAELAGEGLANPEIAEQLFITRKTVEAHLRSVFRKLDVTSREQLRARLGR